MTEQRPEMIYVEGLKHFLRTLTLSDSDLEELRIFIVQQQQQRRQENPC